MATVVSILDRGSWRSRTDNIVVADPARHLLLWVPRDLWSPMLGNRINTAFAKGGQELLSRALAEFEIEVSYGICLAREAVTLALAGASVKIPIPYPVTLSYPLSPDHPIEEGRRRVTFNPPSEVLSGERIHQWIGARFGYGPAASDLGRIHRQQVFLRALLRDGFDFAQVLEEPEWVRMSHPTAIDELRHVRADWHFDTYGNVVDAKIGGRSVLIARTMVGTIPTDPASPTPAH